MDRASWCLTIACGALLAVVAGCGGDISTSTGNDLYHYTPPAERPGQDLRRADDADVPDGATADLAGSEGGAAGDPDLARPAGDLTVAEDLAGPRDMTAAPRDLVGAPRDLVGAPRDLVGAPRDLVGAPRDLVGAPRDMTVPPRDMTVPPRDMTFHHPPSVLVVGWDGLQREHFKDCRSKTLARCPNGLASFDALTGGKSHILTVTSSATVTKPGWTELMTGYDASSLGIHDNRRFCAIPAGYSVHEKLEQHFGQANIYTAFLAAKDEHTGGDCTTVPQEPWCLAKAGMDVFENALGDNASVGNRALALLDTVRGKRFFALVHFENPDHAGHQYGENSSQYTDAILDTDRWLGRIVEKLKTTGMYDATTVYVVTDHGFDEGKTTHLNAPYGIMGSNDPGVARGGDRKDIAPTILKKFGATLGAVGSAPALPGQPLDVVPQTCVAEGKAYVDYVGAKTCCSGLKVVGLQKVDDAGACLLPTGAANDSSGYCTRCGNGKCLPPENRCNCPADCK